MSTLLFGAENSEILNAISKEKYSRSYTVTAKPSVALSKGGVSGKNAENFRSIRSVLTITTFNGQKTQKRRPLSLRVPVPA